MSIYEKVSNIQKNLADKDIKMGELNTLLKPIFEECFKEKITLYFTFTGEEGILHLKSWKNEGKVGTRDEMNVRTPLPEGVLDMKNLSEELTAIKKNLLINTFLVLGGGKCSCDCHKKTALVEDKPGLDIPNQIQNAARLCKKLNGGITEKGLIEKISELRTKKRITQDEEPELLEFIKAHYTYIEEQLA